MTEWSIHLETDLTETAIIDIALIMCNLLYECDKESKKKHYLRVRKILTKQLKQDAL